MNEETLIYIFPAIMGFIRQFPDMGVVFYKKSFTNKQFAQIEETIASRVEDFTSTRSLPWLSTQRIVFLRNIFSLLFWSLYVQRRHLLDARIEKLMREKLHAVWDLATKLSRDGDLSPPIIARIRAFVRLAKVERFNFFISLNKRGSFGFVGHNVYERRLLITRFRELEIPFFFHAGYVIRRQCNSRDFLPTIPSPRLLAVFEKLVPEKEVEKFWSNRLVGNTVNTDTEHAIANSRRDRFDSDTDKNVIFLPVFRDSPFALLDHNRIFSDYIDWLEESLSVMASDSSLWLLKLHPSAKRWGEDSSIFIKNLLYKVFGRIQPTNIRVIGNEYDYESLLIGAKKAITFRGTIHLEFACFGKRAIVVNRCLLSELAPDLVLKPESKNEYASLMTTKDAEIFRLSESQRQQAKRLLYYRETMLPFRDDIGAKSYLMNDPTHEKIMNRNQIQAGVYRQFPKLERLGYLLASGETQTCSLRLLDALTSEAL